MTAQELQTPANKWMVWTGRVLTAVPLLMLAMSGVMKMMNRPEIVEGFAKFGFPEGVAAKIGALELACAVIAAIPQTAMLGTVLLTGYLGGAIVTHVRVGEGFVAPLVMGIVLWLGLFLRDSRVRALLPLRKL